MFPALDDADKRYNSETAEIESKLQDMENSVRSYLDDILKPTEKVNLDFKIDAVIQDVDSFKKIIPRVEDLIKNGDEDKYNSNWYRGQTLLDVRNKLLKIRKDIEGEKIYQMRTEKYQRVNSSETIEHNRIEISDAWKPHVSIFKPYSYLLDSLDDILKTFEMNVKEKSHRSRLSEYQKKIIKMTKHRKITRQIKSLTTYATWKVKQADGLRAYRGTPDAACTTDFSFNVCAICYSLVWHEGTPISSSFHEETKPALEEGEKAISIDTGRF